MPPLKPEVATVEGKIWVFVGSTYQILTGDQTRTLIRNLQGAEAKLRRAEKRAKRAARKASA